MSARDYFDGCHNGPLTATPDLTLADAVLAAERRRADDGQLCLPAEFLPIPDGALFG
jgi:hypothetical protein